MKTIWKFPFGITDEVPIFMPKNARILKVDIQDNIPCIWATVDTEERSERRIFRVYGTGHPVENEGIYIGTIFQNSFVRHVFEEKSNADC